MYHNGVGAQDYESRKAQNNTRLFIGNKIDAYRSEKILRCKGTCKVYANEKGQEKGGFSGQF